MFKYENYKNQDERKQIYKSKVINNKSFINDFLMIFINRK